MRVIPKEIKVGKPFTTGCRSTSTASSTSALLATSLSGSFEEIDGFVSPGRGGGTFSSGSRGLLRGGGRSGSLLLLLLLLLLLNVLGNSLREEKKDAKH